MTTAQFKVEHKALRLFFSKFLSGLWYKALEVSQRCAGKVVTFVQESLLILVVRHMSNTCPGWILGINESVNVKGNLIFTKCILYVGIQAGQSDGQACVLPATACH